MNANRLAESHRRQFQGEDFQTVAIDIADGAKISFESEEYTKLMSAPDPGCECSFCKSAPWED
jgi:hypothetical protein